MDTLSDPAVKTYNYLRLGVVGMAFALTISLAVEIGNDGLLGSISAYYYTPVRGIFVGVLVAVGLALIAIKGREGPEDVMLNLAGMLAPLVALVPTPISTTVDGLNPKGRSIPAELVPSVENNLVAILALGAVGVVVGYLTLPAEGSTERKPMVLGLAVGATLWAGFTLWFVLGRASFLEFGHYAAAIPMFLLLAGVAAVNALNAADRDQDVVRGLKPTQYKALYAVIAALTLAVIGLAGLAFSVEALTSADLPTWWLFVVEAALLALFAAFWLGQTFENWKVGSAVVDQPAPQAKPDTGPGVPVT